MCKGPQSFCTPSLTNPYWIPFLISAPRSTMFIWLSCSILASFIMDTPWPSDVRYKRACSIASIVTNSLWHYGLYKDYKPGQARLVCPWDPPGKNTGGLTCTPPGKLPDLGIGPSSLALQADSLLLSHQGSPIFSSTFKQILSVLMFFVLKDH